MKILIADDNPQLRRVLRMLLETHAGWEVCREAVNGMEAIAMARECHPDLILLDLAMPGMDGLAAARQISRTLPGIPIMMHTLYASTILEAEAKKAGVLRVVSKSEGQKLIPAIEEVLAAIPPPDPKNTLSHAGCPPNPSSLSSDLIPAKLPASSTHEK